MSDWAPSLKNPNIQTHEYGLRVVLKHPTPCLKMLKSWKWIRRRCVLIVCEFIKRKLLISCNILHVFGYQHCLMQVFYIFYECSFIYRTFSIIGNFQNIEKHLVEHQIRVSMLFYDVFKMYNLPKIQQLRKYLLQTHCGPRLGKVWNDPCNSLATFSCMVVHATSLLSYQKLDGNWHGSTWDCTPECFDRRPHWTNAWSGLWASFHVGRAPTRFYIKTGWRCSHVVNYKMSSNYIMAVC